MVQKKGRKPPLSSGDDYLSGQRQPYEELTKIEYKARFGCPELYVDLVYYYDYDYDY